MSGSAPAWNVPANKPSAASALAWSVCALLWEGMSALSLLRESYAVALVAHILCAVSLAFAAARGDVRRRARSSGSVGVWALCVPVLAPLGLFIIVLPALRRLRPHCPDGVAVIELSRPRLTPPTAAQALPLRELLTELGLSSSARAAALMALRNAELTRAAPLLRMALLDTHEDLRLLAYALLERREKRLRERIDVATKQLRAARDVASCRVLLEQLCSDHWLLLEAGFVSGDTASTTLATALDCGERALRLRDDAALRLLLARICLGAGQSVRAQAHLEHAKRLGTGRSVLAPLLAHAAFQQGRFREISGLLSVSSSAQLARPEEQGARAYWARWECV